MYADEQDEDVEEEEEFHDVEEEKHRTSQESVGSNGDAIQSPVRNKTITHRTKLEETTAESQPDASVVNENASTNPSEIDTATSSETVEEKQTPREVATNTTDATLTSEPRTNQHVETTPDPVVEGKHHQPEELSSEKATVSNAENDAFKLDAEAPDGATSSQQSEKSTYDWANMMLADHSSDSDSISEATLSSDKAQSECEEPKPSDDSIMNNIIKDTEEKLKIVEESKDSIDPEVQPKSASPIHQTQEPSEQTACPNESNDLVRKPTEDDANKEDTQSIDTNDAAPGDEADEKKVEDVENKVEEAENKVEEVEKKELDLDEDVKNPQYIPKKGVFYEHDDRSHDVEEKKPISSVKKEDDSTEAKEASANKKNTSQDRQPENRRNNRRQRTDADRWNHDLFRGEKQKPKSKSELINAYGYDIRQERGGRGRTDGRQPRTINSTTNDRPPGSQDSQRSRQPKDGRNQRQTQDRGNRSRDRKARRQNSARNGQQRTDGTPILESKRDGPNNRSARPDIKDLKESGDSVKQTTPPSSVMPTNSRRDQEGSGNRNARNDSKGRGRKTSRDRPLNADDRLPPPNAVMPPITTWSNEDMMKAEAFGKKSPPRIQPTNTTVAANSINSASQRDRSTDFWHQNTQQNKNSYPDRPMRGQDDPRQQGFNSRSRYQDRGSDNNRQTNLVHRNHYNDRGNQQQDWNRASNFSPYGKSTDYVVKTQTFENSRLTQANINRAAQSRDLREVINERRLQGQQNYQPKMHHSAEHHLNQRGSGQSHMYQQQPYAQSHNVMHQHQQQMGHSQQPNSQQHLIHHHHQQSQAHQQPQHSQPHGERQQQAAPQQSTSSQNQSRSSTSSQAQNDRQQPASIQPQAQQRSNISMNNVSNDTAGQDPARLGQTNSTDPLSSRPIIKTDAYTGTGMLSHQQPLPQHSQNHRSMTGPMAQQGPSTSHMVPSHLGASSSQYYAPSPNPRDAAVASAYHGYIPGGHAVMDATRYHMASQQLADHGYMTNPGQGSDVPGGPVLHQQGMYADASAGVASSAYLPQPPGSTISPTANIPVTGTGGQPLPPVNPYLQHSQYPPPPYSNPYSQHNQGPPQSGHGYPPYWTYI